MTIKGAYAGCRFCFGRGCISCSSQKKKDAMAMESQILKPIFTADRNNSDDMDALKRVIGGDALIKAFGPDGGGVQEIKLNAAMESLKQCLAREQAKRDGEK